MRNKWIRIVSLGLVIALMLALVGVAQAQTTLSGVITATNADLISVPPVYTLTVDVTDGGTTTTYIVSVDEATYNAVSVGDIIQFMGTAADDPLTPETEFEATSVVVVGGQVTGTVVSCDDVAGTILLNTSEGPVSVPLPEGASCADYPVDSEATFDVLDSESATGTVVSCSDITGIIVVDTGDGEASLRLPAGTSCEDFPVGSPVSIVGGEEDVQEVKNNFDGTRGYYCTDAESTHPMVSRLSERYGVDEVKIRGWFCSGFGFGEIMLALQTASTTGLTPDEYLAVRGSGLGWGQIWKMDGLVLAESDALPPGQAKKNNPDAAPGNSGNAPGHNQAGEETTSTSSEDCPGNSCNAPGQNRSDENNNTVNSNTNTSEECHGNSCNAPGHSEDNNQSQNQSNSNQGNGNSGNHGNSGNAPGHNK